MRFSGVGEQAPANPALPFKQAVALGQITQWNAEKLLALLQKLDVAYDRDSIDQRLQKAHLWLDRYNPDESIALLANPNAAYGQALDAAGRHRIARLAAFLRTNPQSVAELETEVYEIPKDPSLDEKQLKAAQRAFFKDVYSLLIGKETGPRLSTFLWAVDRDKTLDLLEAAQA
jgi:lysyl-tRNA synthetase class 1